MIRVAYHLTESQLAQLKAMAEKSGLSVSELIRRAIDAYLDQQVQKSK